MNLHLIPDARLSWRFTSVQATLLLGLVSSIQAELFPVLEPLFSPEAWRYVLPVWTVLIFVLRLIAQPALEPQRRQLEAWTEHAAINSAAPAASAASDSASRSIDSLAMALYRANSPGKAWARVSPASQHKWRLVARAALQHSQAADGAANDGHL